MNYISLYRKWRSQNFDEIIGQEVIVKTLKNAIESNRLAHAYLFSGPRGTGKTSCARILAKALNCEQGPTISPCDKCINCKKIRDGQSVNVIEIDAASNRGIDEIRDLRDKIRYTPVEGRYKVYIIDEVHMLTSEAFNALLKTLEEPPSHTLFVLATTELQKVPLTISSRCQRLDFKRIKLAQIEQHLAEIAKKEGFNLDTKAINLIARVAEGCMRDAISLMDQAVSFSGNTVSYDDVVNMLGTADEEMLFEFGEAIAQNNIATTMQLVEKAIEQGRSTNQVTKDLVMHFRNLLHLKVGSGEALELTREYMDRLKNQASQFSLERIKTIISSLARAELDMKWHQHSRLVLEVALLEVLGSLNGVEARNDISKVEIESRQPVSPTVTRIETDNRISRVRSNWSAILDCVKKKSIFSYVSLHEGEPVEINEKGKLIVAFKKGYAFHKERLEETKNKQAVEEALQEILGEKMLIEGIIRDNGGKTNLSARSVADFFEGRIL